VAAHLVDAVLVGLVGVGLAMVVSAALGPAARVETLATGAARLVLDPVRFPLQAAAATVASGVYFAVAWSGPWMGTAGQRALRITVVDASTHRRLGLSQALVRWLLLGAPFGLLAALVIDAAPIWVLVVAAANAWSIILLVSSLRHARRRGLHDRVSGSVVLQLSALARRVESTQ
jgi:hypothetical protein